MAGPRYALHSNHAWRVGQSPEHLREQRRNLPLGAATRRRSGKFDVGSFVDTGPQWEDAASRNACDTSCYSPPPRGGMAARSRKAAQQPQTAETGWAKSFLTTPYAPTQGCLRRFVLMSRPPLLCEEGTSGQFAISSAFKIQTT